MENKTEMYYPSQKTIDKARDETFFGLKNYEEIRQVATESQNNYTKQLKSRILFN